MDILSGLNEMQKKAVKHTEGPLLLLAGAGSGKTRVLTHRIANIIEKGVNPYNIVAITFTNKASKEMKERVLEITPEGRNVWVSTFHSMCVRILREHIDKLGYEKSFSIFDSTDTEKVIKNALSELNLSEKHFKPSSIKNAISNLKNDLISSQDYANQEGKTSREVEISKLYSMYEEKLNNNNALDFDDLIYKTVLLFKSNKDILEKYQKRFEYILVDEYQDTNTPQYELIKMIADKHKNLFVVGDDDQSIYGWRGANIDNILNFEKDYENALVLKLEENYRSTKKILETANKIIKNNKGRKDKKLWTQSEEGNQIKYYKAYNEQEEAVYVINKIKKEIEENNENYSNFAVLYRTNSQSRQIEDNLVKANIPYTLYGGTKFYERKEIKDILAYLRLIYNMNDEISLMRVINVPKRGIGNGTINKVYEYAQDNGLKILDALSKVEKIDTIGSRSKNINRFYNLVKGLKEKSIELNIFELIEETLDKINYIEELKNEQTEEANSRIENIDEFLNKAREFTQNNEDSSLEKFLEEISLVTEVNNLEGSQSTVTLMTLHSSKGLEFKNVFIVGFEENIFPSYRSISTGDDKDLEEERRLCYVGITRAEKTLYLTSANSRMLHGRVTSNKISRFYDELNKDYIDDESPIKKVKKQSRISKLPKRGYEESIERTRQFMRSTKSINEMFGAENNKSLDFEVGDTIRQIKYGKGVVKKITSAGADFEVTVDFGPDKGEKKFMGILSKLKKV